MKVSGSWLIWGYCWLLLDSANMEINAGRDSSYSSFSSFPLPPHLPPFPLLSSFFFFLLLVMVQFRQHLPFHRTMQSITRKNRFYKNKNIEPKWRRIKLNQPEGLQHRSHVHEPVILTYTHDVHFNDLNMEKRLWCHLPNDVLIEESLILILNDFNPLHGFHTVGLFLCLVLSALGCMWKLFETL